MKTKEKKQIRELTVEKERLRQERRDVNMRIENLESSKANFNTKIVEIKAEINLQNEKRDKINRMSL